MHCCDREDPKASRMTRGQQRGQNILSAGKMSKDITTNSFVRYCVNFFSVLPPFIYSEFFKLPSLKTQAGVEKPGGVLSASLKDRKTQEYAIDLALDSVAL